MTYCLINFFLSYCFGLVGGPKSNTIVGPAPKTRDLGNRLEMM